MKTCSACGGIIGVDCFNEIDCLAISASAADSHSEQLRRELDWEREVVVPDLEGKIADAYRTIRDLVNILDAAALNYEHRELVDRVKEHYPLSELPAETQTDNDELPF